MKSKLLLFNIVTVLALAIVLLRGQGAGPLNPPSAPADGVYRTLEEIYKAAADPRTPIDSLPFTISEPGSYYLRSNLHFSDPAGHAITIDASYVTLDLNGFGLSSDPAVTGSGIYILHGREMIVVRNGFIDGTTTVPHFGGPISPGGFANGIATSSPPAQYDCQFEGLIITDCRSKGLCLGVGSLIERCSVRQCGTDGIVSDGLVRWTTATFNGGDGIVGSTVSDCEATWNRGNGIGWISASRPTNLAVNCHVIGNGIYGIVADAIVNCSGITSRLAARPAGQGGVVTRSVGDTIEGDPVRTGNYPAP